MPIQRMRDTTCYYRLDGGDGLPVLVLSHSLGQDHSMWDPQAMDLAPYFRVLRYDTRGHGASGVTAGDYTIEQLSRDVLALTDALGIDTFAFCGLSLGGMIGQWLAANVPHRLTAAVFANTSARADRAGMEARRTLVLERGMSSVADAVMGRFFSARLLEENPPAVASARRTLLATDPIGYAGCCAAVRDMDQTSLLSRIEVPSLIIGSDRDPSLPWVGHSDLLEREIVGARPVHLDTAHISNLEAPRAFSAALFEFLLPGQADAKESGLLTRRAVLGSAHVDRAIASADLFTREFQDLIARYAWGEIWSRPGLDPRMRRLLVLVITASMARWEEFRLHVRAGLARELEACDLKEALLQTAIYAGVPAANTAFRIAAEELSARRDMPSDEGERE